MTEFAYSQLGSTDLQISRFVLGAGNMGGVAMLTGPGIGLDDAASFEVLDAARILGVNVIDTADVYTGGASERIVGQWVAEHADAPTLIQTKTGMTKDGPSLAPDRLRAQLQRSAQTLGRVDLYLAHAVDPNTPWDQSLPVFSEAVDQGQIRAYGLSNISAAELHSALAVADRLGLQRPSIVQNRFSLIARDDAAELLPLVQAESIAYTPYSPLAGGVLSGRYSGDAAAAHGSRLSTQAPTLAALEDPAFLEGIRHFDALAAEHELTPATLAYAWLINQPGVTAPIVGVSKPGHWDAIIASTAVEWTAELAAAVDGVFPRGR